MNMKPCLQGSGSEFIATAGAEGPHNDAEINTEEDIQAPHWESDF